jgi:hypothetical protein
LKGGLRGRGDVMLGGVGGGFDGNRRMWRAGERMWRSRTVGGLILYGICKFDVFWSPGVVAPF